MIDLNRFHIMLMGDSVMFLLRYRFRFMSVSSLIKIILIFYSHINFFLNLDFFLFIIKLLFLSLFFGLLLQFFLQLFLLNNLSLLFLTIPIILSMFFGIFDSIEFMGLLSVSNLLILLVRFGLTSGVSFSGEIGFRVIVDIVFISIEDVAGSLVFFSHC